MQNSSAQCGRGEQQLWCGGRTSSRLVHKPIAVPTTDGCVDKGCEKERTWSNDVRMWHCSMWRWRDKHNWVLEDLEESIREQRDEDQQTKRWRMSLKLKGKINKTVVRPALLYRAVIWATTIGQDARLEVNEMTMLRWMCGVTGMKLAHQRADSQSQSGSDRRVKRGLIHRPIHALAAGSARENILAAFGAAH